MKTPHVVIITRPGESAKKWLEIHIASLDPTIALEDQVDALYKIGNSDNWEARSVSLKELQEFTEKLTGTANDARQKYHREVRLDAENKHNLRHAK